MKIFNLTDVESPALKQRGLVNQSIAVGDKMLPPGGDDDIDDATFARVQPALQELVSLGAMACGSLPDSYKIAKANKPAVTPAVPPRSGGSDEPASPPTVSEKRKR